MILFFDPEGTGDQHIALERSLYEVDGKGVRQQENHITAFIDGSNVYGSDETRAKALRSFDGTGRMKTSAGRLLPYNLESLPNAMPGPGAPESFFLAGDFRANEQIGLIAMHTLFVREHNHWVEYFRKKNPSLTGDALYYRARAMVGAIIQRITYSEFLPVLLGKKSLPRYKGYKPHVNPGISNVFATAAYRFGHSLVSSSLSLLNNKRKRIGRVPLREAFFNPSWVATNGIDDLLRGMAFQVAQRYDPLMVDDLRNFLFGKPGQGGFDLASLNIQRGRDHGLPSYNQIRKDFGLKPVKWFSQITKSRSMRNRLKKVYDNVNEVDMWVGGLAEKPAGGGVVGKTVRKILREQFRRLRDGDRYWYEIYLPKYLVKLVKKQTLAKVIKRNTRIGKEIGKTRVFS